MAGGGSRYRFELTRLEVAGVIVSTAASLFIVFLLGVYTGGGMSERRLADEGRVVRLPAAENATEPASEPALDEMLAGGVRHAPGETRPGDERGAPSERGAGEQQEGATGEPGSHAPGRPPADSGEHAPTPHGAEPAAVAANEPPPNGSHREAASNGAAATARQPAGAGAAQLAAGAPTPAASPQARIAVAMVPNLAANPPVQRGVWSVQVTATRDPRTADNLLRRLRAKGYDAYVVKAMRQGETFYRVRVGHFPSMEYAGQMVSRLRREPGVPEAFVASD
jgi:cell division septation protein DedD